MDTVIHHRRKTDRNRNARPTWRAFLFLELVGYGSCAAIRNTSIACQLMAISSQHIGILIVNIVPGPEQDPPAVWPAPASWRPAFGVRQRAFPARDAPWSQRHWDDGGGVTGQVSSPAVLPMKVKRHCDQAGSEDYPARCLRCMPGLARIGFATINSSPITGSHSIRAPDVILCQQAHMIVDFRASLFDNPLRRRRSFRCGSPSTAFSSLPFRVAQRVGP